MIVIFIPIMGWTGRWIAVVALVATLCAAAVAPQARAATRRPHIVVTTSILGDLVRELVGPRADVTEVMPNGVDPHEFLASLRDVSRLGGADLIVQNGLGLETSLRGAIRQSGAPVFTAGDHVVLRYVDGAPDPHIWMDPLQMRRVVGALAADLRARLGLDVSDRAAALRARLLRLYDTLRARAMRLPAGRRVLVTGHESMGYFARAFGFRLVGAVIPSLSPEAAASGARVAGLARAIRDAHVPAMFTERGTPSQVTTAIADETGVPVITVATHALPPTGGYAGLVTRAMDRIVAGLSAEPPPPRVQPVVDVLLLRAILAGVLVAVCAGVVGTFVVLRGLAFIGDALAHGVLPGVAMAMLMGAPGMLGAAVGAGVMIGGVALVTRASRLSGDTAIGLLFVGMLALGVVIVSHASSLAGDLTGILFGDVLGISPRDLVVQTVLTTAVLAVATVCARPFTLLCVDPEGATVAGFPAARYHGIMLALIAATVVVSFRSVGTLLMFGMLVAPPATAALVAHRVGTMMAVASGLGAASVVAGLLISYRWGTAGGATIVLVQVSVFLATLAVTALRTRRVPQPAVAA
ncbi:MAG: metal ABC transporter permease [Thermoleophilia bacterium]